MGADGAAALCASEAARRGLRLRRAAPGGHPDGAGWEALRELLLAGGVAKGLRMEAVNGLAGLYRKPFSDKTTAAELRSAAAEGGWTHVLIAAGRDSGGPLTVAAAGAVETVFAAMEVNESRVSHGVSWHCCEGNSDQSFFGFQPNSDLDKSGTLFWLLGPGGGGRANDVSDLRGCYKLVWGFSL